MKLYELEKQYDQLKTEALNRLREVIQDNGGTIETGEEPFFLIHQPEFRIETITTHTYTVDLSDEVFPIEDLEFNDIMYLIGNYTKDQFENYNQLALEYELDHPRRNWKPEEIKAELQSRAEKPIIIKLDGGLVQDIIPKKKVYEIWDYDVDGMDWEDLEEVDGVMIHKTIIEP